MSLNLCSDVCHPLSVRGLSRTSLYKKHPIAPGGSVAVSFPLPPTSVRPPPGNIPKGVLGRKARGAKEAAGWCPGACIPTTGTAMSSTGTTQQTGVQSRTDIFAA
jgi:hypothetical protein